MTPPSQPERRWPEQKASDTERVWTIWQCECGEVNNAAIEGACRTCGSPDSYPTFDVVPLSALEKEKAEREAVEQNVRFALKQIDHRMECTGGRATEADCPRCLASKALHSALTDEPNREDVLDPSSEDYPVDECDDPWSVTE